MEYLSLEAGSKWTRLADLFSTGTVTFFLRLTYIMHVFKFVLSQVSHYVVPINYISRAYISAL